MDSNAWVLHCYNNDHMQYGKWDYLASGLHLWVEDLGSNAKVPAQACDLPYKHLLDKVRTPSVLALASSVPSN